MPRCEYEIYGQASELLYCRNSQPHKKLFKSKGACQGKGGFNNGKKNGIKVSALWSVQMRVKNCKEAELICHGCGASLLISKDEDGSCYVSARPQEFEPKVAAAQ